MNLQIRRAEQADVPALAALYVEFHNFHAIGVPSRLRVVEPAEDLPKAIGEILANPEAVVFVAVLDGVVCGFVEIYRKEVKEEPAVVGRRFAHLQSLAVTASHRRHGIGARLVAAAQQWAQEGGATEIELDTWEFPAGPLRFYESLGYTTMRRQLSVRLPERT